MMGPNVSIVNVVGGGELGVRLDLSQLFHELNVQEVEYEPETSGMLKVKLKKGGPTIMLFSSGNYFLAGASSVGRAKKEYRDMISELEQSGLDTNNPYFEIRNIVCKIESEKEFELSELSIGLGLEYCEYDPEQSYGLLCRFPDCESVFIIFRTGVILSMGARTADSILDDIDLLIKRFDKININIAPLE